MTTALQPEPLTQAAFAPYGDVIEAPANSANRMNDGRFERFSELANLEIVPPASTRIDIVRCLEPTTLPYSIDTMERHPLGSQAFIPLSQFRFFVVVANSTATLGPDTIRAFVSNGQQGINYHRGTWHMPMIALAAGQSFLVIERGGDEHNCEEVRLPTPILLLDEPVQA